MEPQMAKRPTKKARLSRKTNEFRAPARTDQIIENGKGNLVGTIRVLPSGVKWRAVNKQRFHSVRLRKFVEWITNPETKAQMTKN